MLPRLAFEVVEVLREERAHSSLNGVDICARNSELVFFDDTAGSGVEHEFAKESVTFEEIDINLREFMPEPMTTVNPEPPFGYLLSEWGWNQHVDDGESSLFAHLLSLREELGEDGILSWRYPIHIFVQTERDFFSA